jgi:cell wall-associated NlpC family hydrolase
VKELLLLLVFALVGLPVVLSDRLSSFQPPAPIQPVVVTVPTVAPPRAPVPTPLPGLAADVPPSSRFEALFAVAKTYLGVPYLFGGCSRSGLDCSCFVRLAYSAIGINLSRTTVSQKHDLPQVPISQMQPGDIVQFNDTCTGCGPNPTHEALAIGNGQIIQAGGSNVNIRPLAGFYPVADVLRVH